MINNLRKEGIIQSHSVLENKTQSKSTKIDRKRISLYKASYKLISNAVTKKLAQNYRATLKTANEFIDLDGSNAYPYISQDFKFLELLEHLASEVRLENKMMHLFDYKYKLKIQHMVVWFAYANGSLIMHHSLIIKYKIKPFRPMIGGQSLVHILCINDSSVALRRVLEASRWYYMNSKTNKARVIQREALFREKFNIGETYSMNTPAHLCLIYHSHECFRVLMDFGVDLFIPNARGWTASDLIQKLILFRSPSEKAIKGSDVIANVLGYFNQNIIFSLKTQSLINKYFESEKPEEGVKALRRMLEDPKRYFEKNFDLTESDIGGIVDEFKFLYQNHEKEYLKMVKFCDHVLQRKEEGEEEQGSPMPDRPTMSHQRTKQDNLVDVYEGLYEIEFLNSIRENNVTYQTPLSSNLKHLYDMKEILAIVVYTNINNPKKLMIYEQLKKIKKRYQHEDGGISIEVVKGMPKVKGFMQKYMMCLRKSNIFKSQFSKHKFFFLVNISSKLLIKKAKELKLTGFDMKDGYYTNFDSGKSNEDLEPLRETQKQSVVMKLINEEFNLEKFKRDGYVFDYFMLHRYKMKHNMLRCWTKNINVVHLENFLTKTNVKALTPVSLLAFYHGIQHGFYFGFLSLYTNCLSYLAALGLIFELLMNYQGISKRVLPYMAVFVSLWSMVFINLWENREKELAYSFGTHKELVINQQREEYKGRSVLKPISNVIVKEAKISTNLKRVLVSFLYFCEFFMYKWILISFCIQLETRVSSLLIDF